RGVNPTGALQAQQVLRRLQETGLPGAFGHQRFGAMGTNHLVGRALLRGEHEDVLKLLLGPGEGRMHPRSRALYAEGNLREAMDALPRAARAERSVLGPLLRGATPAEAVGAMSTPERRFFITAAQSAIFNELLRHRMADGSWDRLLEGDLAMKLEGRATFAVAPQEIE